MEGVFEYFQFPAAGLNKFEIKKQLQRDTVSVLKGKAF